MGTYISAYGFTAIHIHVQTMVVRNASVIPGRPTLLGQEDDEGEVKLITTRKQKSEAMKIQSVKAEKRCLVLFKYIKDQSWSEVLQHLDYYERDASHWIEEVNDDGTKRWRSLPIHLVRLLQKNNDKILIFIGTYLTRSIPYSITHLGMRKETLF